MHVFWVTLRTDFQKGSPRLLHSNVLSLLCQESLICWNYPLCHYVHNLSASNVSREIPFKGFAICIKLIKTFLSYGPWELNNYRMFCHIHYVHKDLVFYEACLYVTETVFSQKFSPHSLYSKHCSTCLIFSYGKKSSFWLTYFLFLINS